MRKKGFTLVELLVVISLIGILVAIGLVSYQGTRRSARDGKRKADLQQIRAALEMYRSDNGKYPPDLGTIDTSIGLVGGSCTTPSSGWTTGGLQTLETTNYLAKLPLDSLNNCSYYYAYEPPATDGTTKEYWLGAALENTSDPEINRATCVPSVFYSSTPINYCLKNP